MDKTLKEAFDGLETISEKVKLDPEYASQIRKDVIDCIMLIQDKTHLLQVETFKYIKSKGYDDVEALHVFTRVCSFIGGSIGLRMEIKKP